MIFIVGVGRSGTSLLQSMFAAHPDIACLPETVFLRRFVARGLIRGLSAAGSDAVVRLLAADRYFARTGLDPADTVARATRGGSLDDVSVYRAMVATFAERHGATHVADKDPRSIEYLPLLYRVFPDVRVVHVLRDPRDVLLSRKTAAWSKGHSLLRHAFAIRVQMRMAKLVGRRLPASRFVTLRYEDLLRGPRESLESLCDSLGIGFDERMLVFGDAARGLVSEEEMDWKKETLGPLLQDNAGKWNGALPDTETALLERACPTAFELGRYGRSDIERDLGMVDRVRVRAGAAVTTVLDPPYRLYRAMRTAAMVHRL